MASGEWRVASRGNALSIRHSLFAIRLASNQSLLAQSPQQLIGCVFDVRSSAGTPGFQEQLQAVSPPGALDDGFRHAQQELARIRQRLQLAAVRQGDDRG